MQPVSVIDQKVYQHLPKGCSQLYETLKTFDYANRKGYVWPTIETLAARQFVHPNTVRTRLKALEKAGLIQRERVAGRQDNWFFCNPQPSSSPITTHVRLVKANAADEASPEVNHSITRQSMPFPRASLEIKPDKKAYPNNSRSLPPAEIVGGGNKLPVRGGYNTGVHEEEEAKNKNINNQINVANHSHLGGLGGEQQLIDLGDFKPLQIESPVQTVAKTATVDVAPVGTDLSDYKSFLSSKFDRQKVTDKLLDLIDDDFKANAKNAITTLHNQKNHLALFPVSLCRYLRDNLGKINNKSAYIYGALTNPEKYDMIVTAASQLDTAWRIEYADTKYLKRQQDHWRSISLDNTPYSAEELEEKTRFHAKLRADIAAKAGKLDMFDKDGKLDMRTPRPRGLTEREWCQQNGWEYDEWYKTNHDGKDWREEQKKIDDLVRKAGGQINIRDDREDSLFAKLGAGYDMSN
jgi:hypothetical protein